MYYDKDDDGDINEDNLVLISSGIQAKLYNQDLSLDASFDAGGNIGR